MLPSTNHLLRRSVILDSLSKISPDNAYTFFVPSFPFIHATDHLRSPPLLPQCPANVTDFSTIRPRPTHLSLFPFLFRVFDLSLSLYSVSHLVSSLSYRSRSLNLFSPSPLPSLLSPLVVSFRLSYVPNTVCLSVCLSVSLYARRRSRSIRFVDSIYFPSISKWELIHLISFHPSSHRFDYVRRALACVVTFFDSDSDSPSPFPPTTTTMAPYPSHSYPSDFDRLTG